MDTTEVHFDAGALIQHQVTPEGFLRAYFRIAHTGKLRYLNSDGSIRNEWVTPETLFEKESIDSFKGKPITLGHPPKFVDASNAHQYSKGQLGTLALLEPKAIAVDADFLGIVGVITHKDTIDAVLNQKIRGNSCGYHATIVPRDDGDFDQLKRRGNHVAICEDPRARFAGVMITDSVDSFWQSDADLQQFLAHTDPDWIEALLEGRLDSDQVIYRQPTIKLMTKKSVDINGIRFDLEDAQLLGAIASQQQQLTDAQQQLATLKTELTAAQTAKGEAVGKVALLEQQLTDAVAKADANSDTAIAAKVAEAIEVWGAALPVLKKDAANYQPDYELSAHEIRKAALSKLLPENHPARTQINFDSESEVKGAWGVFAAGLSSKSGASDTAKQITDSALTAVNQATETTKTDAIAEAREKHRKAVELANKRSA